jgi:F-type H+-transporting ATPase subunit epsilon
MAQNFQLEVATPERLVIREQVTEAQIPAKEGMIGVLPDHAALVGELGTGTLSYMQPDGKTSMVICGGFLEIRDNHVRVLADRAEKIDEIDLARAQAALKRAEERLAAPASAGIDVARALNAMHRAEARIAAAKTR